MRLLGGIILAVVVLMMYYLLVEYVPFYMKTSVSEVITYNEYIAPPNAAQYFTYFAIILVTFVVGYVAYRTRY
jgi:ABC-type phosphate transport system permease subunit